MRGEQPNAPTGAAVQTDERARGDEAALAKRAVAGDAEAFGALYDRYVDAVYRYAYYRVRNEADAEDVTSEVFFKALRAMSRYEPRQPFLAWLYRIARNTIIDRARRQRPQLAFEDALAHPGADRIVDPDAGLDRLSDSQALRDAIARLTPLQQDVIILRYLEGLDTKAIGRIIGRRDGTVRGIEFRALGTLRQMLPREAAL
ncbi:MAG: sigma-70 family RNA polymerase sigma factor [Chloroflexota bacterium]|nr:sigma-70 family RNA polymerase sigma factor [Chloroflexota bacterium]MDE3194516.1 sigma-70 family RNA polymerase sigma factor [Chloroflexota bacterium]